MIFTLSSIIAETGMFGGGPCSRQKLYSTCDMSTVCRPHGVVKLVTRAQGMQALQKLVTAHKKNLSMGLGPPCYLRRCKGPGDTMALSQRQQQCNSLKPPVSYGVIDCHWKVFTPVLSCCKTCAVFGVDRILYVCVFGVTKPELNNVAVLPASESATPR